MLTISSSSAIELCCCDLTRSTSARSAADGAPIAVPTPHTRAKKIERVTIRSTDRMAEFHLWSRSPHDTRQMTSDTSQAAPAVTAEGETFASAPKRLKYVSV